MIYPFRKHEKNIADFFETSNDAIKLIIPDYADIKSKNSEKIEHLKILYGREATAISINLHPHYKNTPPNEKDAFIGWKMMNKIWVALNSTQKEAQASSLEIDKLEKWAQNCVERQKNHTYIAIIAHVSKHIIQHNSCKSDKIFLLKLIKKITPYLFQASLKC